MDTTIRIRLDGLGMNERAMLELVRADDRKWVLERPLAHYNIINPAFSFPSIGDCLEPSTAFGWGLF